MSKNVEFRFIDLSKEGLYPVSGINADVIVADVPSLADLNRGGSKVSFENGRGDLKTWSSLYNFWRFSKRSTPFILIGSLLTGICAGFFPDVLNCVINMMPILSDSIFFGGVCSLALLSYATPYISGVAAKRSKEKFSNLLNEIERASDNMKDSLASLAKKFELENLFSAGAKITPFEAKLDGKPGVRALGEVVPVEKDNVLVLKIESVKPANMVLYLVAAKGVFCKNPKALYGFVHDSNNCSGDSNLVSQIVAAGNVNAVSYVVNSSGIDIQSLEYKYSPYVKAKKNK